MSTQGIHLSWIVVKDLKAAIQFYTRVAGLHVSNSNEEFGWAELRGNDGSVLGLAQENQEPHVKAGQNAVVTLTVDSLDESRDFFMKQGVRFLGEVQEVLGHVKMQTFMDPDNNILQLVQVLAKDPS